MNSQYYTQVPNGIDHDPMRSLAPYPQPQEPKTQKYPKVHRVFIKSDALMSGSAVDGYYNIQLKTPITSDKAMLVLDTLLIESVAVQDIVSAYEIFEFRIRNLNQMNTTITGDFREDIVAVFKGLEYNNYANKESLGFPVVDKTFFNNNVWNIYFTSPTIDGSIDGVFAGKWCAVIYIVELE
jgi:hypothetical protein